MTGPALPTLAVVLSMLSGPWINSAVAPPESLGATSNIQQQPPPLITFGPGEHRVGVGGIPPGRYFSRPAASCYWERRSTTMSTPTTVAFGFFGDAAAQGIVDVQPGDYAFHPNDRCGLWSNQAGEPLQNRIPPGTWLVGPQVRPGTYSSLVAAGCYWERLADFTGASSSVIARGLSSKSGTEHLTIFPNDAGVRSDPACGSWMPMAPPAPTLRIVN